MNPGKNVYALFLNSCETYNRKRKAHIKEAHPCTSI
jgi:hypothetical protein